MLRPEGFGFKPRNAVVEKGTCLYCDITSRGKRVTGNFKKTLQFADTKKIFTVGATGIPRNKIIHILMYFIETRQVGLEQESAKYGSATKKGKEEGITFRCFKLTSENTS